LLPRGLRNSTGKYRAMKRPPAELPNRPTYKIRAASVLRRIGASEKLRIVEKS